MCPGSPWKPHYDTPLHFLISPNRRTLTPFPDPCTGSSREPTPVIDATCTAIPNRRHTTDIPVRLFGGYDPRTFADNAIFVNMKHKKTYGLIAIALLVFVSLNFRLMRVEKLEIVDVVFNEEEH